MHKGEVQHVFLVSAKSLGSYGDYETFINKLTEYHQNDDTRIKYHAACKANGDGCMDEAKVEGISDVVKKNGETVEFTYHNARCFKIKILEKLGPAQAIYYDVKSLEECCKYINRVYGSKGIGGNNPETTFIAYGAETRQSKLTDDDE